MNTDHFNELLKASNKVIDFYKENRKNKKITDLEIYLINRAEELNIRISNTDGYWKNHWTIELHAVNICLKELKK